MPTLPPIRLVDYFVEHLAYDVLVEANARGAPEDRAPFGNIGLDVHYDGDVTPEEGAREGWETLAFHVTVNVNPEAETPEPVSYRAVVRFAGLFERKRYATLDPAPGEQAYHTHCLASVLSTLYGAARELIASLTAPTPFRKLVLPSISPYAVAEAMLKEKAALEGTADTSDGPQG
ncbi:MAG: hypothetical protein AAGN64_15180 [Bacteroidota bacterium]